MKLSALACLILAVVCVVTFVDRADGADRYLIEFSAKGATLPDCLLVSWQDEVVLHNTTSTAAAIRLIDVSNGGIRPGVATSFVLAPGETSSLLAKTGANWTPNQAAPVPLWISHLDIPTGVAVASHGDIGKAGSCCNCVNPGTFDATAFGSFALPVFGTLVAANEPQLHLGVGLGQLTSHLNIGVFNGSSSPANAVIAIDSNCTGGAVDRRNVVVPPNTVIQFSGFSRTSCADGPVTLSSTYNVTVTVDQPSLSFVSSVADVQPPIAGSSFSAPN